MTQTLEQTLASMLRDLAETGASVDTFYVSRSDNGPKISVTYYPTKSYYSSESISGYEWAEILAELRRRIDRAKTIEMKLIKHGGSGGGD